MGRNHAIKTFDPGRRTGQPLDLFTGRNVRAPVLRELLRSPWLMRGSQLPVSSPGAAAKRCEEGIEVTWDAERGTPGSFVWRGKRYRVEVLVHTWSVEQGWWLPHSHVSRRCFRVLARGGLYDLAYDRLGRRWLFIGVVD